MVKAEILSPIITIINTIHFCTIQFASLGLFSLVSKGNISAATFYCYPSDSVVMQVWWNINNFYLDPPTIQEATSSTHKSWIGQAVTLRCVSDGVPTPTLTWYKPDGSQINSITAAENTVNVTMSIDQDFDGYKCDADNGLTPADFKIVPKIEQISRLFCRSELFCVDI